MTRKGHGLSNLEEFGVEGMYSGVGGLNPGMDAIDPRDSEARREGRAARQKPSFRSDAHGHQDVAVLVLGVGIFGAHLAGGLRVLELEAHLAGVVEGLEEV